jgi:hypothetical protein
METKITNIVLDIDRFIVFATINGVEEKNIFMPEVTANDILVWLNERIEYYDSLKIKEDELKKQFNLI